MKNLLRRKLLVCMWVGICMQDNFVSSSRPTVSRPSYRGTFNNAVTPVSSSFDSVDVYQQLNFKANWTSQKLFWKSKDFDFEDRYVREQTCYTDDEDCEIPHVNVIVVPFSHNDPGWLKTFEGYYEDKTKHILDNAVKKLAQHRNMTFVWSEISFFSKWWDETTAQQKKALRQLINEGRFEILTGGWVMPDEASTSVFALLNQLIEGHTWLKRNLKYKPQAASSIDPFGHSSTMPYLLKNIGLEGMMIQRLHYAWKHWLAEHKKGDFLWSQRWDTTGKHDIHCLNAPYDLYPTKHACGPTPEVCMQFNFRNIPGKGGEEHLRFMRPVESGNIVRLADDLIGQYRRTASLTKHNVVVTGLGNDFEFDEETEWDQQYYNYERLFQFINNNPHRYNARVQFGTLSQYFKMVKDSNIELPKFRGDFFPYSDVYFPYPPAYWTGFYGTRPFWKKLSRETEDELRKAEILFSYTINFLRQSNYSVEAQELSNSFQKLVQARRWVALFQHHDGITGTSPRPTMVDYAVKLFEAIKFSEEIQGNCVRILIQRQLANQQSSSEDLVRETFTNLADQVPLRFSSDVIVKKVVFFNSLGWKKSHLVRILVDTPDVAVFDSSGDPIMSQLNPKLGVTETGEAGIFAGYFELTFVAYLQPLAFTTYEVHKVKPGSKQRAVQAVVQCRYCGYKVAIIEQSEIVLENERIEVTFDGESGLLREIYRKMDQVSTAFNVKYGKYETGYGAGAYLLRPNTTNPVDLLSDCKSTKQLYILRGPVLQEITLICEELMVSQYVLKEGYNEALSALYLSNSVKPRHTNYGEFFMSLHTDLETRTKSDFSGIAEPTFYTDTGIGVEKRMRVSRVPYEGNMYPVVNFAFIQDTQAEKRLSVVVDRAHGFTSTKSGQLETIYDRRLQYDDARGMDEGVNDPEDMVSNYAILLEPLTQDNDEDAMLPTLKLQRAVKFLNHQPSAFVYDHVDTHSQLVNPSMSIFTRELPPDIFLLNMRTTPGPSRGVPSRKALLTLQNLGHQQRTHYSHRSDAQTLNSDLRLNHVVESTDLVGSSESDNQYLQDEYLMRTAQIPQGNPFELSTFAVHF